MTEKEKVIEDETIELPIEPTEKKKPHRRRAVVITVVALALLAAGGIAWKTHTDRLMAAARADCATAAERLRTATNDYDTLLNGDAAAVAKTDTKSVKDARTLDSLSKAMKASTPKVVSCRADSRDGVQEAAKRVTENAAWYKTHRKSLSKAVKAVESSKLDKTVDDAQALYDSTDGKVADDKTREELKQAISKRDAGAIAKAVKAVNDSRTAKEKADAEAKARAEQEAAAAAIAVVFERQIVLIQRRFLVHATTVQQQQWRWIVLVGRFQFRPAHRHRWQRRARPERAMQARKHLHGWRLQHLPMIRHMMRAFLPADVQTGLVKTGF